MTWDARPICLVCQRIIHGPGTGPVGPRPGTAIIKDESDYRVPADTPKCVLCARLASPAAFMRLWQGPKGDPWKASIE